MREELIAQAKELFKRGIKSTQDLLKKEDIQVESLVQLEGKLNSQQRPELLELERQYSAYIRGSEEHHFIQGYLAAKGYEDGLQPVQENESSTERKIIYIDKIQKGVILALNGMLVVGTGTEDAIQ